MATNAEILNALDAARAERDAQLDRLVRREASTFRAPQVVLFTTDLPRAVAFWTAVGFTEVFCTPPQGDPIHVDVELDGYRIGLATVDSSRDDHGLSPGEPQRAVVVLWCDDTHHGLQTLLDAGATPLSKPQPWLDRLLIAWAADPDGNPVQVVQNL